MLRSQVQKQGAFYVCSSCRQQNLHNSTKVRPRTPISDRISPHTSRLFSSALRTVLQPRSPREPQDAGSRAHDDFSPAATWTGVRAYSSYGKFGSRTLPGQTNADWARAVVPPAAWGGIKPGGFQAGKIPPAKPTSISPAKPTSVPETKPSATEKAPLPGDSRQPTSDAVQPTAQAAATPGDNIAQKRTWQPTGPRPFILPPAFANRSTIPPAKGTSVLRKFEPRPSPPPENVSGGGYTQKAVANTSHSASGAQPVAQESGPNGQSQPSQGFSVERRVIEPPPQAAGARYPHLHRRYPGVDDFETLSPFNLPVAGKSSSHIPGNNPLENPSPTLSQRPPRGSPSDPRVPDPTSSRGNPSAVGGSAPASVDSTADARLNVGTSSDDALLNPLNTSKSTDSTNGRQTSQPQDPFDQFSKVYNESEAQQSDWGLIKGDLVSPGGRLDESDLASPEERHAQRRRENALRQAEIRAQGWEARSAGVRERESDRGAQRRGGGRDSERLEDRPKRRQSHRTGEYRQDGDDDGHDPAFDYEEYQARKQAAIRRKEEKRAAKKAEAPKTIVLPQYITVVDLAEALGVRPQQFLSDLGELGFEDILHDSIMTGETAALVAAEYGLNPVLDTGDDIDLKPRPPPEDPTTLPPRPPIVTIMGHVDHGKTTMLDWLRKSSVAAQEHGGITQHIGAFSVRLSTGKVITFLDTPGHAAFLSMRQRGANVTDIVVLVVAVDDSVKPQTLEALKHSQNANVPIIVAINKIDVDEGRVDKVKQDLAANGVEIEDYGGDVQVVAVSGRTGKGMDDLEESILTLSEILDVRAEMDGMAEGWILEASVRVDGKAATVLVKRGTLRVGDLIVAGTTYARIRMMRNEAGVDVKEAGPGTPVEVLGWRDAPVAGDLVLQAEDEDRAQAAVDYRAELADRTRAAAQKAEEELKNREKAEQEALEKMTAEDDKEAVPEEAQESGPKVVNTIVRGDVMGSVEAVCTAVMEIGNNEVHARVLKSSPGQINESDIDLMAVAKGCIINFNNPIAGYIKSMAEDKGVRILDHSIIYHLVEDVKAMMSEQLPPIISQKVLAEAEVLQVFSINIVKRTYKNIAGVKVKRGTLTRGGLYRVMRDGEKIFEGKLDALKQGKKDMKEMRSGTECGVSFESWDQFEVGDVVQLYEVVQQKRYL